MNSRGTDRFPIEPPVEPMLARLAPTVPAGPGWLFEPKWDGFRALVFRAGDRLFIQSRDLKPLDRYFPELVPALREALPARCVIDGEIVIATEQGLDFDALQLRLHPAASRVATLAAATPASFVAFDLLAEGDDDLRPRPQRERRMQLEVTLARARDRVHVTPCTREPAIAEDWFLRFEGAGFDGVVAKREEAPYQPGMRAMIKVKHARTADCVVAGFRWHKHGPGTLIGSLLLGLYDDGGALHHVGVTAAFSMAQRRQLAEALAPLRADALAAHPWRDSARPGGGSVRMPGGQSRWSAGKDLSWEPLRIERVCEVQYDHMQGDRFRHAAIFRRWRPDKPPEDCRYDQLEIVAPVELTELFRPPAPGRPAPRPTRPSRRG